MSGFGAPVVFRDSIRDERCFSNMKKEMLINVLQPEESRIAIVEDGVLEELYVERNSADNFVGNIYKGRVVNIEPSIQAAFVDFGVGRNGFLHVSDVEYQYYKELQPQNGRRSEASDSRGRKSATTTAAPATSRPFRTFSSVATRCSCKSSRKAWEPRGRRFRLTLAFPAGIWS